MNTLLPNIRTELKNYMRESAHLIVALSGGADSVALLRSLRALQEEFSYTLEAVHVEHGIRGEESLRDADFSKKLCESLQIPVTVVSVDAPNLAERDGLSLEEAARILRYEKLREQAKKYQNAYIVTAHHVEDQAETILLHLVRGSGPDGLVGMQVLSGDIFRPMLSVTREQIEDYLTELGQDFCTDSTNLDLQNPRNRIRKEILPVLTELNPNALLHMKKTAEDLQEERAYIQSEAEALLRKYKAPHKELRALRIISSGEEFLKKEVLRLFLTENLSSRGHDLNRAQVEGAYELLLGGAGTENSMPDGEVLIRTKDYLLLTNSQDRMRDLEQVLLLEKPEQKFPMLRLEDLDFEQAITLEDSEEVTVEVPTEPKVCFTFTRESWSKMDEIPEPVYTKVLDYAKINATLVLRGRRAGDVISTTPDGHKALKDYFINEKIPKEIRDRLPLVTMGQEVLMIPGGRIGERYKVTDTTETVLKITWRFKDE